MNLDLEYFDIANSLIGCDEVGRGPIAGPVNGCAVLVRKSEIGIIEHLHMLGVTDSKKLTQKKRLLILNELGINLESLKIGVVNILHYKNFQFNFTLEEHSPSDIDKMNILQASLSCMKNAAKSFNEEDAFILIDGNKSFELPASGINPIVKGDSKSVVIGLASIIAKEYRDHLMEKLDIIYPGYGLKKHAGYPTKDHKEAVKNLGVTPIHRKTFKGVKEYIGL